MKLKPKNTTINQRALVYRRYNQIIDSNKLGVVYQTPDNKYWLFDANLVSFNEIPSNEVLPTATIINITLINIYQYQTSFFAYVSWANGFMWQKFLDNPQSSYTFTNIKLYLNSNDRLYHSEPIPIYMTCEKAGTNYGRLAVSNNSSSTMTFRCTVGSNTITSLSFAINGGATKSNFLSFDDPVVVRYFEVTSETNTMANFTLTFNDVKTSSFLNAINTLFPKIATIAKYQKNAYYYVGSFAFMLRGSVSGSTSQYIKGNIVPLTSMNIKYFDDSVDLQVDDLVVVNGKLYSVENPETDFKFQPKGYKIHFVTLNNIL